MNNYLHFHLRQNNKVIMPTVFIIMYQWRVLNISLFRPFRRYVVDLKFSLTCVPLTRPTSSSEWKLRKFVRIASENIFVTLDMKGCICHFVKWQIHPFLSKGTNCHLANVLIISHLIQIRRLTTAIDVIITLTLEALKYSSIYHGVQRVWIWNHCKCLS